MTRSPEEERLAQIMAERTRTRAEDWYLTFKARHGMLVAFRCMRDLMGEGSVVTQLLTCCTAVDPIIAAGLIPRYAEVSRCAASICPEKLTMPDDAHAVVLQHTYGIIDPVDSVNLAAKARSTGALVVEDCAHGVSRMAYGADGKPVADISIHSFGVAKILQTSFGGAVWVNPDSPASEVCAELRRRLEALPVTGAHLTSLTRTFLFWNRVFNHLPHGFSLALRHGLSRMGVFEPAVSQAEQRGQVSHEPMRPSAEVCEHAIRAFEGLDRDMEGRAAAVEAYVEGFRDMEGVDLFSSACTSPAQPLLKFPILLRDTATADRAIEASCAAGYYTSLLYRPELGPGILDEAPYRLPADRTGVAVCDDIVARVATLPTNVDPAGARKVIDAVRAVVSS